MGERQKHLAQWGDSERPCPGGRTPGQGQRPPPSSPHRKDLVTSTHDAVIIGAGPNGLAAGITLAQAGRSVLILEARETVGGGCRTLELTLPGYRHDPCSAIHPLAVVSPFFRTLPLADCGLEMIEPPLALANPFDDGTAAVLAKSIDETAASLGPDGDAYKRLLDPLLEDQEILIPELLGPLRIPPRHPIAMARF